MDEGFLLKASLVCSIIGVAALYFIAGRIEIEETPISRITMGQSDGSVAAKGKVSRIFEKEDVMIFELEKNEKISVVIFKKNYPQYIGLKEGDFVEVEGKVQDYKGEKELIAENVRFAGG